MIIEKIHINSFGKLNNCDFEFSNGVNVIEGSNEAGKSTVAAFIKFLLYGLSSKARDGQVSERERYVSWENGTAGGYMVITVKDRAYRIERLLSTVGQSGDGADKKATYRENYGITDLSNNSPVKIKSEPGEYFFGVDEEVFSKTAYVGQLEGVRISGEKMTQAIENILFTADENVNIQKALKKIDAARVTLLHKNQKGGKIYELESGKTVLETALENSKKINSDILSLESSLEDAKIKSEELSGKVSKLSKSILAFESTKVLSLFESLHNFEKKCAECEEKEREFVEKYSKIGFVPDREYLSAIKKLKETQELEHKRLEETAQRLREAQMQKAELEKSYLEGRDKTDKYDKDIDFCEHGLSAVKQLNVWIVTFFVLAGVFAGVGMASIMLDFMTEIGKIVLDCSAFPFIGAVISMIIRSAKIAGVRKVFKEYGAYDFANLRELISKIKSEGDEVKRAEIRISELEHESRLRQEALANLTQEADKLLAKCDQSIDVLEADIAGCEAARNEKVNNLEKAELLKKQLSAYDEARLKTVECAEQNGEITEGNINEKRRELDFIKNQSRAMETRIHELEKELAGLKPQSENSAKIAEKAELIKSVLEEYRLKHTAYLLAYEKISEASDSMRADISPKLAKETCKTMGEVTSGKYTELGVDGELNLSVTVDGVTRKLDALSAGTQDAAYVSLRLALMHSLFGENTPPVLFDESFSRLDENRLSGVLTLTKKLAENGVQSIILTSGRREAEIMKNIGKCNKISI